MKEGRSCTLAKQVIILSQCQIISLIEIWVFRADLLLVICSLAGSYFLKLENSFTKVPETYTWTQNANSCNQDIGEIALEVFGVQLLGRSPKGMKQCRRRGSRLSYWLLKHVCILPNAYRACFPIPLFRDFRNELGFELMTFIFSL